LRKKEGLGLSGEKRGGEADRQGGGLLSQSRNIRKEGEVEDFRDSLSLEEGGTHAGDQDNGTALLGQGGKRLPVGVKKGLPSTKGASTKQSQGKKGTAC